MIAKKRISAKEGNGYGFDEGSVTKTMLRFTLPILLMNVINQAYSIADGVITARFSCWRGRRSQCSSCTSGCGARRRQMGFSTRINV